MDDDTKELAELTEEQAAHVRFVLYEQRDVPLTERTALGSENAHLARRAGLGEQIVTGIIGILLLLTVAGTVQAGERVTRHQRGEQTPVSRITRAANAPTPITYQRYSQPQPVGTPMPLRSGRAGRSGR